MLLRIFFIAGMLASAVAGCASGAGYGGANPSPTPTPTFTPRCLIAQPNIQQAFPIAGATGVTFSTNLPRVVFQAFAGFDFSTWQVQLVPAGSSTPQLGGNLGPPPQPLPSPIASLAPGNAYFGATIPPPLAATTYQLQLLPVPSCLGPQTTGTFTTQ